MHIRNIFTISLFMISSLVLAESKTDVMRVMRMQKPTKDQSANRLTPSEQKEFLRLSKELKKCDQLKIFGLQDRCRKKHAPTYQLLLGKMSGQPLGQPIANGQPLGQPIANCNFNIPTDCKDKICENLRDELLATQAKCKKANSGQPLGQTLANGAHVYDCKFQSSTNCAPNDMVCKNLQSDLQSLETKCKESWAKCERSLKDLAQSKASLTQKAASDPSFCKNPLAIQAANDACPIDVKLDQAPPNYRTILQGITGNASGNEPGAIQGADSIQAAYASSADFVNQMIANKCMRTQSGSGGPASQNAN